MKNILFNTEMTKAILDGKKTQTRRVAKVYDVDPYYVKDNIDEVIKKHSKYQKGDILWVREPAKVIDYIESNITMKVEYVDGETKIIDIPERFLDENGYIKASWIKNMKGIPNGCIKEMARIFLKITDVRVERLQDITYQDILYEGKNDPYADVYGTGWLENKATLISPQDSEFKQISDWIIMWWINLWNKTSPRSYKWDDNPYVFVYEFERVNND